MNRISYSSEKIDLEFSFKKGIEDDILLKVSANTTSTAKEISKKKVKPALEEKNENEKSDGVCNTPSGKSIKNRRLPQKLATPLVDGLVRDSLSSGWTGAASTFVISLPNTIKKRSKIQRRSRW